MENGSKNNRIFNRKLTYYWAATLLISSAVFISFFVIKNFDVVVNYAASIIKKFLKALTPFTIGIILSYLFNKPVMFFERFLKKIKRKREISIAILYIIIFGGISIVINFVVPGIQKNIVQLSNIDLPGYSGIIVSYYQKIIDWLQSVGIKIDYNSIQDNMSVQNFLYKFTNISSLVLDSIMSFIKGLTQGIFNFFLAMILSFYMLQKKEKLLSSVKELVYLYGSKFIKESLLDEVKEFNNILNSYISGVLIDAMIICILTMTGLKIIGHQYFILMGVLTGLLNLIPYFGSLISCTIACLLALFQGIPKMFTTLLVLILIQQMDGNIIQPKIVGNKVGLEPLWVITAVLVFGNFWGIPGMILAVPFTALIKTIIRKTVERKREEVKNCQISNINHP